MSELILFASTFSLVFLLGLQSLNVNHGRYVTAFVTSTCIGVMNIIVLKLAPSATPTEIAAYIAGGPFGIIAAMQFFGWLKRRREAANED